MGKRFEMWCCSIAVDHELGATDVTLYPSEAALVKACRCVREAIPGDRNACHPVRLMVEVGQ